MKMSAEDILAEYLNDPEAAFRVNQLVRMKNCPSEVIDKVALDEPFNAFPESGLYEWQAKHFARRSEKLSTSTLDLYVKWVIENPLSAYLVDDIFHNPNLSARMIKKILESSDKKNVVRDEKLSEQYWSRDSFTPIHLRDNYLFALAHHPNLPLDFLAMATSHKEAYVRVKAANNPKLSLTQINTLLMDSSSSVRCNIVRNKAVPLSQLLYLIDPNSERKRLGGEFRVIQTLIRRLPNGADKDRALECLKSFNNGQKTRLMVAKLSKDPQELAQRAMDPNYAVRQVAIKNAKTEPEYKAAAALLGRENRPGPKRSK